MISFAQAASLLVLVFMGYFLTTGKAPDVSLRGAILMGLVLGTIVAIFNLSVSRKCPFCSERILRECTVCKYCKKEIKEHDKENT